MERMSFMAITPIGSNNNFSMHSSAAENLELLKNQRKNLEEQQKTLNSSELQNKIDSLNKRISNLEKRVSKPSGEEECQTCKNRKYKDGSDDPGVSFKSASKISKGNAASVVRRHENEHVVRERAKAEREGREVISQNVTIKNAICPECGKSYVAGGETVTVTKEKPENKFKVGMEDSTQNSGQFLNSSI